MGFTNISYKKSDNRIFLDREDILNSIEKNVIKYNEQEAFFKLFVFYGMGGIGKSRLIQKIIDTYKGTCPTLYYYPLEILNQETIPSILLSVRRNFDYAPHFDYALLRYWDFISYDRIDRKSLESISKKFFKKLGQLFNVISDQALFDMEYLIDEIITLCESRIIDNKEKQKVSELLQDKIEDLYIYLIEALTSDIQKEIGEQKYMFLFDAYDLGRSNNKFDWLKHFINFFENGIFFVTSRESLDWFNGPNIDKSKIENYSLEGIPRREVQRYLSEQNYTQEQIDCIVEKTDCIPLYLDLAITMHQITPISPNSIIGFDKKEELVKHLLSHLSSEEQLIIDYLSIVKLFNEEIYDNAIKLNNLSPQKYSFSDFEKSTIVRYVEQCNGLYKIHSVFAQNISIFVDRKVRAKIIRNYLSVMHARILSNVDLYDDEKYNLIINIYQLIEKEQLSISEQQSEMLIDAFLYLFDRNFGENFYRYVNSIRNRKKSTLAYIYEYILGKIKRGKDIIGGLSRLQNIPLNECNFGKHKKTLICDINYLISLSGKYAEAEKQMNEFADALTDREKNEHYYIKGMIYFCDMKMLRGKFKSAVADLELLSNDVFEEKFMYEIQKAIGHCYRFNFMLDDAIKHYSDTKNRPYNTAYYLTVCCETYCYYKPEKVFEYYEEAVEENQLHNNHNNLGKIYYSMAIALLISGKAYKAKTYIQKAYTEFNNTKYYAGKLFTMIAEAYFEYSEKQKLSTRTMIEINKQLKKIDCIYEYLLLPLYILCKDQVKIEELRENFEWFSFDRTMKNINNFLKCL